MKKKQIVFVCGNGFSSQLEPPPKNEKYEEKYTNVRRASQRRREDGAFFCFTEERKGRVSCRIAPVGAHESRLCCYLKEELLAWHFTQEASGPSACAVT